MSTELDLACAAVVGAIAGGTVRPLLAPFDAVAEVWKERVRDRIERTAERANAKRQDPDWLCTERIAVRALAEAALTDEPVVQEYLAGVIAGATNSNDNVHLLSLISRMTPLQLRLHYLIYWGTACLVRDEDDQPGLWRGMSTRSSDALEGLFASSPAAVGIEDGLVLDRCLDTLVREGVLRDVENYTDAPSHPVFVFGLTRFGVELFSAALGLPDGDLTTLLNQHPTSLLFDPPLADVWVEHRDRVAVNLMADLAEMDPDDSDLGEDPF